MTTLQELIARWDSDEGKPYKGSLIDWAAYLKDPTNIGCMCAEGQVLHLIGGRTPESLYNLPQDVADRETAKLLNISVTHAVLLRQVNDTVDGAPSIVLTNPEKILGDQAHIILSFWHHLDRMKDEQWAAVRAAVRGAPWGAAWAAVSAVRAAVRGAPWAAGGAASYAIAEIQGARLMRERNQLFFFLPMFGFNEPEDILNQSG